MTAPAKRFQEETIKAATAALGGANPLKRFLVADEVGLGKTVVARDVLKNLSAGRRKFVVYYITSGLKVADQNKVELLRFLDDDAAKDALSTIDRLGLVAFEPKARGRMRLYAFTPKTSFSGSQRLYGGKAIERAFIGQLIEAVYPGLKRQLPKGFLEYGATTGWPWARDEAKRQLAHVSRGFIDAYGRALRLEFGTPARARILEAARGPAKHGTTLGRLRKALAQAALDSAPPDLVIFDEFQCYRDLLDPKADNPLARQLVEGAPGVPPPPMLLLSATPYRFYAERWEVAAGVQPHAELFDLIAFLGGAALREKAETLFRHFGDRLHDIGQLAPDARPAVIAEAMSLKRSLEKLLSPLMSRTERPAPKHPEKEPDDPTCIHAHDLDVYRHFVDHVPARLAGAAIAYWLSVPLPAQALGDRYQISRGVKFSAPRDVPRLTAATSFKAPKDSWGSAKLRALNALAPAKALALPWTLPSLSWWAPAGPWSDTPRSTKMLLFSRFRATPQSIAALTSLEVERRHLPRQNLPYAEAWKKRRLNPKPNQAPTLALFHPSPFLIRAVNPLRLRKGATLAQLRKGARQQIVDALPASIKPKAPNARDDRRRKPVWAVLAAIERSQTGVQSTEFASIQRVWGQLDKKDATLTALVKQRADAPAIGWVSTGELDGLVDMALGAPGVVVGRALSRHLPELFDFKANHYARLVRFAWTRLRTYLDRPVFWSVLPGDDATAKYQRASLDGCLEAVLDEHFWLRKSKVNPSGLIDDLGTALAANIGTFAFRVGGKADRIRIRCHAAVPFGGTERDSSQKETPEAGEPPPPRSEEIRNAFNTPFWPHVLATTSVGQEGLDFHSWCDQLGHWDLCSSPVDLEQREGRIQRFGGLTVRLPMAEALGHPALAEARLEGASPWDIIAREADAAYGDDSQLSPWWTMPGAEIKRHMFALPQSRDLERFARLRRQRALYRLALGQPNPEDLVDMLDQGGETHGDDFKGLALDLSAWSRRTPEE